MELSTKLPTIHAPAMMRAGCLRKDPSPQGDKSKKEAGRKVASTMTMLSLAAIAALPGSLQLNFNLFQSFEHLTPSCVSLCHLKNAKKISLVRLLKPKIVFLNKKTMKISQKLERPDPSMKPPSNKLVLASKITNVPHFCETQQSAKLLELL